MFSFWCEACLGFSLKAKHLPWVSHFLILSRSLSSLQLAPRVCRFSAYAASLSTVSSAEFWWTDITWIRVRGFLLAYIGVFFSILCDISIQYLLLLAVL